MNSNELNKKILDKVKTKIAISNFEEKERFSMPKNKILTTAASLFLAFGLTCGIAYAGYQLTNYFRVKGIDDTGIQTALQNNYVQNIDMDYIEKEQVKFKVDYLMMDDANFDLVFNFVTEDNVNNYEAISVTNLEITDENNNQIYIDSEDHNVWTKNISLSSLMWTVIEKQDHTLRQVVHLSSNNFPKSNKIYVSFDNVVLYNVNNGTPITIEYKDDYKLEFNVSDQLSNRTSIEYTTNDENIAQAKLTNSGFVVTSNKNWSKSETDNFTLEDSNGNKYTISNILQIHNSEKPEIIEKTVLIFNMTKYNETENIILTQENGNTIEFIKK